MEFYDVGTSDLRELWDTYLIEPTFGHDVLMNMREDEWGVLCSKDKTSMSVVLRDRLMTDAALGGSKPIKTEHSYSLLACSPPPSPSESPSDANHHHHHHTPHSLDSTNSAISAGSTTVISCSSNTTVETHKTMELRSRIHVVDMEEECFPAISMKTASSRESLSSPPPSPSPSIEPSKLSLIVEGGSGGGGGYCTTVKSETISEPESPEETCNLDEKNHTITMVEPHRLHFARNSVCQTSESDDDEDELYERMDLEEFEVTCAESGETFSASRQVLPPTPPSSASSDSEGTASASCSPERRDPQSSSTHVQNLRGLLTPRLYVSNGIHTHTTTRQPIHTPLISCQPKGSTGNLTLTEEEKRTLIAEGYPVPTKLPLTKQEEKSLKKVRRKIKNKISAQESRRKKKEYMDGLERRVTVLTNENSSYRDRLTDLEDTNRELLKELHRLQALLQLQSS
ncbi:cyclic AMP response element-binding protein A [Leptopilina boulardi]|uniref:cyclic AMP response element-binding protein A n=1 Tax=Leptopilina boulardi TaxID=63433 RepID=UPI0021F5F746|nr:cyclic AMP response element-binding protein A [Leptopilina boulardi]